MGQISRKKNKFISAKKLYEEALQLAVDHNDIGLQGNLIGGLGKMEMEQGRYEDAKDLLGEALQLLDGRDADRLIFGALSGHLASLNYITGNLSEAEWLGMICLNIFDEIGGETDVSLTLARIFGMQNRRYEAVEMASRSIQFFEKLGMLSELEHAKVLLSNLQNLE